MELVLEKFKKTDIGVIPSEWGLGNMFDNSTLKARIGWQGLTTAEYLHTGNYFLVTGTDFFGGKIKWETCHYVVEERYVQDKNIQLKANDILVTKDGTIGKVAFVDKITLPSTLNSGVFVIRPKNNSYNPQFLYFVLKSAYFDDFLNQLVAGSTILHLYQKDFIHFKFPLPGNEEQTAIGNALSDADALITGLEKLIAKKRLIKQGAMQQLLQSKGGWEVKKLGELGECIIGLTYKPNNVKETGTLVLRSSNVQGNILKYDNNVFVDCEISEKLTNKENDILICVRNGSRNLIGKCALIKGKAIGETFGAFMSVFRSPFNEYVFILFQSDIIKKQIDEHLGATINQITNKSLNSFEIPFPPKEEQTRIASILSDMDAELTALEQKLEKYKKVKLGMMQELLTGKTRLV